MTEENPIEEQQQIIPEDKPVNTDVPKKIEKLSAEKRRKQIIGMDIAEQGKPIKITDDRKVQKIILKEGNGAWAKRGQKVGIHYIAKVQETGEVFENTREKDKFYEFVVGKDGIEGLSLAVATMRGKEVAQIIIDPEYGYGEAGFPPLVPPNAILEYEVELLFLMEDMCEDEARIEAEKMNSRANDKYREGNYYAAVTYYKEALSTLKMHQGDDLILMRKKYHGNLAVTYSKVNRWGKSHKYAELVLKREKTNIKALLRKLDSEIHLGRIDEAKQTLQDGLATSNNDPTFVAMKSQLRAKEIEIQQTQNQVFSKMTAKKL